jgi:hypothetical protein
MALAFLLCLSHFGVARLNLVNCGVADFVSKKIALLNNKVPVLADFGAIVPLHALVKRKTVLSNFALCFSERLSESPISVPKTVYSSFVRYSANSILKVINQSTKIRGFLAVNYFYNCFFSVIISCFSSYYWQQVFVCLVSDAVTFVLHCHFHGCPRAKKRVQHSVAFDAKHFDETLSNFVWISCGSPFQFISRLPCAF